MMHTRLSERRAATVPTPFDARRRVILLAGGNKRGVDQKRFYKRLITIADRRGGGGVGRDAAS